MTFGEFLVNFFAGILSGEAWMVVSAVLAAFVVIATIGGSIALSSRVADTIGWGWNFIVIPIIASAGVIAILFLAWTAYGVNA